MDEMLVCKGYSTDGEDRADKLRFNMSVRWYLACASSTLEAGWTQQSNIHKGRPNHHRRESGRLPRSSGLTP